MYIAAHAALGVLTLINSKISFRTQIISNIICDSKISLARVLAIEFYSWYPSVYCKSPVLLFPSEFTVTQVPCLRSYSWNGCDHQTIFFRYFIFNKSLDFASAVILPTATDSGRIRFRAFFLIKVDRKHFSSSKIKSTSSSFCLFVCLLGNLF